MEKKSELTCADLMLYVGCTCKTPAGHGIIDAVSRERIRVEIEFMGYVLPPDDVTPILRPLSDMTEEEALAWAEFFGGHSVALDEGPITFFRRYYSDYCSAESVLYLLSRHFDLFGWIPTGLAIDKTKI